VLANEQVIDGKGWRSGAPVERRKLAQWFFKITAFADDLLAALDRLERWPEKVRLMQRNWIGRSSGARVRFPIVGRDGEALEIFTTRPDTLWGASFVAIAPDHPLATELAADDPALAAFVEECLRVGTSEEELETAEKRGLDTGLRCRHPLGYTATYAGYATAFTGVAAVIMSPIVAKLSTKVDPRALVCFGILWLGATSLLRVHWNSGADFWTLAMPQLLQGFGMPFFFIPLTTLALAAVEPEETASAAGVMSFLRTMAGAIGTSISATIWDDSSRVARSEIVSKLSTQATSDTLAAQGFSLDQIRGLVVQLVDKEAMAVATTHVFLISAVVFALSAMIIWLTPRPTRSIEAGAAH
jgi:hypothetical protein